jgi:transcriptional regulator with XRE-family HTH domain
VTSSANRARVASELRRTREDSELSGERVAEALGWSQSKLSRIETARFGVSIPDLARLLSYYGVDEDVRAELLTAAAEDSGVAGAWIVRAGGAPRRQREVSAVESRVARMRQYHPVVIPGQLQSREYSRALAAAAGFADPEGIASRRMQRQRLLDSEDGPDYEAVVDERSIWRWPGPPSVIQGQIQHLVDRATLATVSVRVLPMGGQAGAIGLSPFLIYDFSAKTSPRTVLIETVTTDLYLSASEDVSGYVDLFARLTDEALAPAESIDYLRRLARRVSRSRAK